ncbi:MAG: EAL domain-containing protein [Campylobacterota bacterium]|nr:EAL domain-containing protein [Campylobacterota bacterium]
MTLDVSRLKEITVLYCEDEVSLREVTNGILKSFTKKQYIAEDGAIGLEYFKKYKDEIDLIITDVNMPNMSGLEMSKEIKEISPNVPIIVATAFSNSEYLLEAIELGIDKYVLKPVNMKKLLETMVSSLLYHELRDLYIDNLTHLPNRNALLKYINEQESSLIALLDIDKFSLLNDLYGEDNGDIILNIFTQRLKEYFNIDEFKIYRVGSDRFVVSSLDQSKDINDFKEMITNFLDYNSKNDFKLDDDEVNIDTTVGIAYSDDNHAFEYVQRTIQKAKDKFIDVLVYDKDKFDQKNDYRENIQWIKKLKNGLESGNFQPFFQPIIKSKTKEIYKYESLIRYIDNDGKEIPPYKFLPIAKKAKLYPVIIQVMLSKVIEVIRDKNIRIAVNVSFEDISHQPTYDFILNIVSKNSDITHLLDFELLESEEIEDFNMVKNFITEVKKYGCNMGIDDFGAGYSNFNILDTLDVNYVKIDGSLIKNITTMPKQALIVQTISNFCKELNLKTIAEFVSEEEIYNKINELDIDYTQGYYFGKPMPLKDI